VEREGVPVSHPEPRQFVQVVLARHADRVGENTTGETESEVSQNPLSCRRIAVLASKRIGEVLDAVSQDLLQDSLVVFDLGPLLRFGEQGELHAVMRMPTDGDQAAVLEALDLLRAQRRMAVEFLVGGLGPPTRWFAFEDPSRLRTISAMISLCWDGALSERIP